MKIAVAGGEGTGRTTVAEALSRTLGLPLIPNPRDAIVKGSGYHTLFEWQASTGGLERLVERQVARELECSDAVVDSGALDLWCFFQRWAWNAVSPERAEGLRERILQAANQYSHVLVTAPRLVAGSAPGRFCNRLNIVQSHRLLEALLAELPQPRRIIHRLPAQDSDSVIHAANRALS